MSLKNTFTCCFSDDKNLEQVTNSGGKSWVCYENIGDKK